VKRISIMLMAIVVSAADARAWEAASTHAGLTESAALGSKAHNALTDAHGRALGWYEPLTVPPSAAPGLYTKLASLEPSEGYVPDTRGRQTALGWLLAGTVIADLPSTNGRNHFYDPVHKTGLTGKNLRGLKRFVETRLFAKLVSEVAATSGMAAPDWIVAKQNDLGMDRYWNELEASATAPTKAARDQHLAFALLCAGAMLHVLEDVGSPSRARDDLVEHLSTLGAGPEDRGSRFERLAALGYGRLGVPLSKTPVVRTHARDYFTAADGKGLADLTNQRWFSSGTLPGRTTITSGEDPKAVVAAVVKTLRFASPAPTKLDLDEAASDAGAVLHDANGVCLAEYRLRGDVLGWSIGEDCAADQIATILPVVSSYTTGFLDFLMRGTLVVDATGAVTVGPTALGGGALQILAEAADGTRKPLDTTATAGGEAGTELTSGVELPEGTVRVIAVFRGKDTSGEPLVAVGTAAVVK
jgi:hypothetical protein